MKIVFVHFGKPPAHLIANLRDVCQRFPKFEVVLISDFTLDGRIAFENYSEKFFDVSFLFEYFQLRTTLPVGFRGGFWLLSLIRLVVLADYVESENSSVLHVESDVILASDFPFDFFQQLGNRMAYVRVSYSEAIASLLFIPSAKSARQLRTAIYLELDSDSALTDMKILSIYAHRFPERVFELPSSLNDDPTNDVIFDGSDYGQFLFGTDPRNSRGIKILNFENPNTRIATQSFNYEFSPNRDFINVSDGFVTKRLVSLHIHSKNMKLFDVSSRRKEFLMAINESSRSEIRVFVPKIFLTQFILAVQRRATQWWKNE